MRLSVIRRSPAAGAMALSLPGLADKLAVPSSETGPGGPGDYEIDYDYCKGCGICTAECPCGRDIDSA